ncbi:MAG: hypothetical protein V2A76_19090, partial [Planctomycetota bacterium]
TVLIPDAGGRRLLSAIADGEAGAAANVVVSIPGRHGIMCFGAPLQKSGERILINLEGLSQLRVQVEDPLPAGLVLRAGVLPCGSTQQWPARLPESFQADLVDGRAVLGPIPAVPIDLVLWALDGDEPSYPVAVQSLDLRPGVVDVRFKPLELHRLEVQVEAPATTVNLWNHRIGDVSAEIVDGVAVFPFLPEGEYELGSDTGPCSAPLRVPVEGRVRFTPPPLNAVGVRVIDPEALDSKPGFQDGDLIVGVNGVRFSQTERGVFCIDEVQGEPAEFLVDRKGQQITVETTFVREGLGSMTRGIFYFGSSTETDKAIRIEVPKQKK